MAVGGGWGTLNHIYRESHSTTAPVDRFFAKSNPGDPGDPVVQVIPMVVFFIANFDPNGRFLISLTPITVIQDPDDHLKSFFL